MGGSTEYDALLSCLRGATDPTRDAVIEPLTAAEWGRMIDRAVLHGVAPLLHKRIAANRGSRAIPAAARQRLRAIYTHSAARNLRLFHDLSGVLAGLRDDGIEVVVLKGAHLAQAVYGDIAVRPMGDVDLLVRREDLPRAEAALGRLGYRFVQRGDHGRQWYASGHFHFRYQASRGTIMEIHWDLTDPSGPCRMATRGLWQRAEPVRIANVDVLALCPEDLILHLCLHASHAHEYAWGLRPLCDIAAVLSRYEDRIDWDELLGRAHACRIGAMACCALRLAQELLGGPVPRHVLARLRLDRLEPQLVAMLRSYVLGAPSVPRPHSDEGPWAALAAIAQADGTRDRIPLLLRSVFPPIERLRKIYGLPPRTTRAYVYYLLRPLDLVRRRYWDVLRWALRTPKARRTLDRAKATNAVLRALAAERQPSGPGHAAPSAGPATGPR